jgi:alpha-tubulin suppressor-like RCC1 family protein
MYQQLSAGGFFTCGLKAGGKVDCWGSGIDHPPKSLESLSHEEQSAVKHARRMEQVAEGWSGANSKHVSGGDYYVQVSSGMKHACAISRRDSEVHCWGKNDYGESSPPSGKFVQVS